MMTCAPGVPVCFTVPEKSVCTGWYEQWHIAHHVTRQLRVQLSIPAEYLFILILPGLTVGIRRCCQLDYSSFYSHYGDFLESLLSQNTTSSACAPETGLQQLVATIVPDEQRISFWPQHFGLIPQWVTLEPRVFGWMDRLCEDYCGGIWNLYTLNNGGAFMAPEPDDDDDGTWVLFNAMNGNRAEMSPEAAGIAACLMAYSHHACRTECYAMTVHYYRLRDYALQHPECSAIMRIID